ncbi:MAG: hypothetical protein WAU91_05960, partial [Desulfatitalea sp.]
IQTMERMGHRPHAVYARHKKPNRRGHGKMKEMDDLELKAEIDQISKKIDAIVQKFDELKPARSEDANSQQE